MLEILTFSDLPFWYHCFEFPLLFHMNQNDITWLASQLLSLSCCFTDCCQRSPLLSVSMRGWLLSCFMEWDYHILCFRKWLYFINHILSILLFCVCYFILLFLVFCDFLERNVRFTLHMFMVSDFFFRSHLVTNFGKPIFILG
jgi:hypothetical protein